MKLLTALCIPFSIITDWDPKNGKKPLGVNRALNLITVMEHIRTGKLPKILIKELKAITDWGIFEERCDEFGIFTNIHTLEVDLFKGDFSTQIIETLRERKFSKRKKEWILGWENDPNSLDIDNYLALIETIGKGRFAQRLASRIEDMAPPAYIESAIKFVAGRV